jgi:hypothetical protein
VGRLIALDHGELLGRDRGAREAGAGEVGLLERRERLRVELGLELLEDVGELCIQPSAPVDHGYMRP